MLSIAYTLSPASQSFGLLMAESSTSQQVASSALSYSRSSIGSSKASPQLCQFRLCGQNPGQLVIRTTYLRLPRQTWDSDFQQSD
jgi:hypothetical protein